MSARKKLLETLPEDVRLKRQDEVYRLHCRGLTLRGIGAELGLDVAQVSRSLTQAKAAIRKQKGAKHLANLADRLTEGAWDDMADSFRVAEAAEAVTEWTDPTAEDAERIELPCPDWKTIATERANRIKLRDQIAKFNGLDPIKTQELEMKQRLLKSGESLLSQLVGQGWVCAPPEAPSS